MSGIYSDRAIAERREIRRVTMGCTCPSTQSNHGECPVHDAHGRARKGPTLKQLIRVADSVSWLLAGRGLPVTEGERE
jgi:hypothetical protein